MTHTGRGPRELDLRHVGEECEPRDGEGCVVDGGVVDELGEQRKRQRTCRSAVSPASRSDGDDVGPSTSISPYLWSPGLPQASSSLLVTDASLGSSVQLNRRRAAVMSRALPPA